MPALSFHVMPYPYYYDGDYSIDLFTNPRLTIQVGRIHWDEFSDDIVLYVHNSTPWGEPLPSTIIYLSE